MKATIWHNPRCSKSRATLALLETSGVTLEVVDYLRDPPRRDELAALFAAAGISPRDGLRRDARAVADDAAALDRMAADPATIERPLVRTPLGVRLCRPPERVLEIL